MLQLVLALPLVSTVPPERETEDSPCRCGRLKVDIGVGSPAAPLPDIGSVRINIPQKPGHCF